MVLLQAAPSWDLVITLAFVIGVSYGFIIMRERILVLLMSLYVGTTLSNALVGPIQKFFHGDTAILNKIWVESQMSPFMIKTLVFAAAVVLISAKSGLAGKRGMSLIELAAYSIASVCIGIGSILSFMDPEKAATITQSSKLATLIVNHQMLWLIAPLVVLLFIGGGSIRGGGYDNGY
jgi:hypothetical protein